MSEIEERRTLQQGNLTENLDRMKKRESVRALCTRAVFLRKKWNDKRTSHRILASSVAMKLKAGKVFLFQGYLSVYRWITSFWPQICTQKNLNLKSIRHSPNLATAWERCRWQRRWGWEQAAVPDVFPVSWGSTWSLRYWPCFPSSPAELPSFTPNMILKRVE